MRARIFSLVCWCVAALTCGVSFILLFEGTSYSASCGTFVCQQIEVIRQNYLARRCVFPDPNYHVAVGIYLRDLDRKIAYFESIRRYYPSQQSWNLVVNQTRQNYLTALIALARLGTLAGGSAACTTSGDPATQPAATDMGTASQTAATSTRPKENVSTAANTSASIPPAVAAAATKRIIATFPSGNRYSWKFYPGSAGQPARIVPEGGVP